MDARSLKSKCPRGHASSTDSGGRGEPPALPGSQLGHLSISLQLHTSFSSVCPSFKEIFTYLLIYVSIAGSAVQNLPAKQETWVLSLGQRPSPGRGNGNPFQCFLPGKFHGQRSLAGYSLSSVQFSSVAQWRPTLCDSMNRSIPGLPVHHQVQEFTQTHVHRVGDAIQPSHPLSSPSPPAPNPSQH